MKLVPLLVFAMSIGLSVNAIAASDGHKHKHDHKPKHGGVVTEVKDVEFELVAKPEVIRLYLRDHGKPMSVKDAAAKVTLESKNEKSEVMLAPLGEKLEAKGSFKVAAGTKATAVVTVAGRAPATARFTLK